MTREELVLKFINPITGSTSSYISNGSGKLSKMWNVSRELVKEAKAEARARVNDNQAIPEGYELRSIWGNPNNPMKSYKKIEGSEDVMQNFKDELLNDLKSISKIKRFREVKGDYLLSIDLPDYHFGKIDGFTIDEQAERFIAAGLHLYDKAKGDGVARVLLPVGNDFFNSEFTSTTTKGTPQQNNATFYEMFSKGWTSIITLVDIISQDVPVDIIVVPGNHDTNATIMLGEVLKGYYTKNRMVTVDSDDEFTKYYRFGKNMFLQNHGDKVKPGKLALMMAVKQPEMFRDCPYRYISLGHYHKGLVADEEMGIEIEYKSSLTSADAWHRANGYLSKPKTTATLYHREYGKSTTINIYLEHIKLQ